VADFDAFAPALTADPYPTYERLLAAEPFFDESLRGWVVARHADVCHVLREAHRRLESGDGRGKMVVRV
jgi:cytochrome P450